MSAIYVLRIKTTSIFQTILQNLDHPPLLKGASWTLAAPFKEEKFHRSPSESIANNYSPAASNLKINTLSKRKSLCIHFAEYFSAISNALCNMCTDPHACVFICVSGHVRTYVAILLKVSK